jgi:hypothetical protein
MRYFSYSIDLNSIQEIALGRIRPRTNDGLEEPSLYSYLMFETREWVLFNGQQLI